MKYIISFKDVTLEQLYNLMKYGFKIEFQFKEPRYISIYVSEDMKKEFKTMAGI